MRKPERDLIDRLESERKLGFFTEFFVEAGYLDDPEPVFRAGEADRFFDLASLTKALLTGPLVHHVFEGRLDIPLNGFIPFSAAEAFSPELMNLTLSELLAHRSGLPAWRNLWLGHLFEGPSPAAQFLNPLVPKSFERINPNPLKPDVYSDLGYILLGYLLEAAGGRPLDELWSDYARRIGFDSDRLGFSKQLSASTDDFIPSAFCAIRGRLLQGEVHDENAAALGGVAGHAGLFAKGPSVGDFLRTLSHAIEGKAYLAANAHELANHSFEGLSGLRRGNGQSAQLFAGGRGMGHLGFAGTAFWLDPANGGYAVFLSNRVISGRVNPRMTEVRRDVFGRLHELL